MKIELQQLIEQIKQKHNISNALNADYKAEAVAYLRYSSHRQDGGISIEYQISEVLAYSETEGIKITGWYIDTAKTAREVAGRDDLIKLFQDVENGATPKNLIIFATNRAFRNTAESHQYRAILRKHGVRLHSATQKIDESSSSGRLATNVLADIDQYQSEMTSEFVSAAARYLITEGFFAGGTPPYGLKTQKTLYNGKERVILVPHEEEAAIVKEFFEYVRAGGVISQFEKILQQRGVIGRGGTPMYRDTLRRMLSNIVYKGERLYKMSDGKHAYCAKYCPPIVSKELFDAANKAYESGLKKTRGRKRKNVFPLTGKLVCAECGGAYVGTTVRQYTYYICKGKYSHKKCPSKKIQKRLLELAVFNAIKENVLTDQAINDITKKVLNQIKKAPAIAEDEPTLKKRKNEIEQEIAQIIQIKLDGKIPLSVLDSMTSSKSSELANVEHKLSQLKMAVDKTINAAYIKQSINSIFNRDVPFEVCSPDMLKALFMQTVDKIEISSTQVVIHLRIAITKNKDKQTHSTPFVALSLKIARPNKKQGH